MKGFDLLYFVQKLGLNTVLQLELFEERHLKLNMFNLKPEEWSCGLKTPATPSQNVEE